MMKKTAFDKLDNPVWWSLSETHNQVGIDYGPVKFFDPGYCPFGGFVQPGDMTDAMSRYSELANNFFIVGEKPEVPGTLEVKKELVCLQMIIEQPAVAETVEGIVRLSEQHYNALYQLVNLVQPGYFRNKTARLGEYYGIFRDSQLIAASGERMQMDDLTEVSAVVTHPGHTGKGYAKQLVAHTVNNIFKKGKIPFLHVLETNTGAIRLYEKLGFTTRRKISFWNVATKRFSS